MNSQMAEKDRTKMCEFNDMTTADILKSLIPDDEGDLVSVDGADSDLDLDALTEKAVIQFEKNGRRKPPPAKIWKVICPGEPLKILQKNGTYIQKRVQSSQTNLRACPVLHAAQLLALSPSRGTVSPRKVDRSFRQCSRQRSDHDAR